MNGILPTVCAAEAGSAQTLPVRFAREIAAIVTAARRACAQLLPWAPDEHQAIIREAVKRALDDIHAGRLAGASPDIDLPGYVYGLARSRIQDTHRRRYPVDLHAGSLSARDANGPIAPTARAGERM